jgi:hypothetical protein
MSWQDRPLSPDARDGDHYEVIVGMLVATLTGMRSLLVALVSLGGCSAPPSQQEASTAAVATQEGDELDGVVYLGSFTPAPDSDLNESIAQSPGGLHTYAVDFDLDSVIGQSCSFNIYYRVDGGVGGIDLSAKVSMIASTDSLMLRDAPSMCVDAVCPREDLDPADDQLTYRGLLDAGQWRIDPGERMVRYLLQPSAPVVGSTIKVSASCAATAY